MKSDQREDEVRCSLDIPLNTALVQQLSAKRIASRAHLIFDENAHDDPLFVEIKDSSPL